MKARQPLDVFIRQPFTESDELQRRLVADVLALIEECNGDPYPFNYLTGNKAESSSTFFATFESESGEDFTPSRFREHRLGLLDQADVFINIRVALSESTAFELAYHIFRGARTPILFLVWKHAPIKTTLLKDLHPLCRVAYLEFERPEDLRDSLHAFFDRLQVPAKAARHA